MMINNFLTTIDEWISGKRVMIILLGVGFITYSNILFNDFVLDDIAQIVKNSSIWSLRNIPGLFFSQFGGAETSGYYRPLVYVVYSIVYSMSYESGFLFHAIQILLHIVNSYLVYIILSSFLKKNGSFFLSLVFLVHPINEEAVAYIANLQDVLFVFFGLLALFYLQKNSEKSSSLLYSSLLLLFALFSKETAVLFLVVNLLYVYFFKRNKFFIYSLCSSSAVLIFVFMRAVSRIPFSKEAIVPIMSLPFLERMMNVPAILFYYITTFFYPKDLVVLHSWVIQEIGLNTFVIPLLVAFLFFGSICGMGYVVYRSHKGRYFLFFFLWFLVGIAAHIQIIPIDTTVSDRYFYLPMVGLLAMVGLFIESINFSRAGVIVGMSLFIVVFVALSTRTFIRNRDWKDQSTLISRDIRISGDDYLLELIYSSGLLKDNRDDEAFVHIQKSIALFPESQSAWNNLGVFYLKKGDISQARNALQQSMSHGSFYATYENFAILMYENDPLIDAGDFVKKATSLFPSSEKLWFLRLLIGQKMRDREEMMLSSEKCYRYGQNEQCRVIYERLIQSQPVQ